MKNNNSLMKDLFNDRPEDFSRTHTTYTCAAFAGKISSNFLPTGNPVKTNVGDLFIDGSAGDINTWSGKEWVTLSEYMCVLGMEGDIDLSITDFHHRFPSQIPLQTR